MNTCIKCNRNLVKCLGVDTWYCSNPSCSYFELLPVQIRELENPSQKIDYEEERAIKIQNMWEKLKEYLNFRSDSYKKIDVFKTKWYIKYNPLGFLLSFFYENYYIAKMIDKADEYEEWLDKEFKK